MAIRFLTFIVVTFYIHGLYAMQKPSQPTDLILKPKLNTFIQSTSKPEQAAKARDQERIKILENAFKQIKKAPSNGKKKLSSVDLQKKINLLPLDIQQYIGKMWLTLNITNTIKKHTKELLPAVLDHSSAEHDETIFTSIEWAETMSNKVLNLIDVKQPVEQVVALYCTREATPKNDLMKQEVFTTLEKNKYICFLGVQEDNDAFIMHRYADGSVRFFLNKRNRALLNSLSKQQLDYIIALFYAKNPHQLAQKQKKIHLSLPESMQDVLQDNYGIAFTNCSWR